MDKNDEQEFANLLLEAFLREHPEHQQDTDRSADGRTWFAPHVPKAFNVWAVEKGLCGPEFAIGFNRKLSEWTADFERRRGH